MKEWIPGIFSPSASGNPNRRGFIALSAALVGAFLLGPLRRIASAYRKVTTFPIRSVEGTQEFNPGTWKLKIDGLVETPIELTHQEVLSLPKMTQTKNFVCVEGWGLDNQKWEGFHLSILFDRVKVKPEAQFVIFFATGGTYSDSLTLKEALEPETMLAYKLNDDFLKPEQGRPLRLVIPRMFAYKGVKWVERISLAREQHIGYWERYGYPANAPLP